MTRREFLVAALGIGVAGAAGSLEVGITAGLAARRVRRYVDRYNPYWKVEGDNHPETIGFDEAAQLALRFDRAFDRLPPYKPLVSDEAMVLWAWELLAMYPIEGVSDEVIIPDEIGLRLFYYKEYYEKHEGALGVSDCKSYAFLNLRQGNPYSGLYRNSSFDFTVAHEFAHIFQTEEFCGTRNDPITEEERDLVETTAQIVALEVMSALANGGNIYALYAVAYEMRGIAVSIARATAIREGRQADFKRLRSRLTPGAIAQAKFERNQRNMSEEDLLTLIDRYDLAVLETIMAAQQGDGIVRGLALPPIRKEKNDLGEVVPVAPPRVRDFLIDDTIYLLGNLEAMVENARQKILSGEFKLYPEQ